MLILVYLYLRFCELSYASWHNTNSQPQAISHGMVMPGKQSSQDLEPIHNITLSGSKAASPTRPLNRHPST